MTLPPRTLPPHPTRISAKTRKCMMKTNDKTQQQSYVLNHYRFVGGESTHVFFFGGVCIYDKGRGEKRGRQEAPPCVGARRTHANMRTPHPSPRTDTTLQRDKRLSTMLLLLQLFLGGSAGGGGGLCVGWGEGSGGVEN